jgi:predicted membrane chloride channel (bestrophin family)
MVPVSCLVAIFFFGIEELGVQLEEPFSIMPLEDIVECAESDILQLLTFEKENTVDPMIGSDILSTEELLSLPDGRRYK